MLRPTAPHLRRLDIRPGHWGQWLATGAAGLVGFVVLALLLIFQTTIGELDHRLLATVISIRSPDVTAFASAVTRLGSGSVVVCLGLAATLVLGLRSRRVLSPLALLGALAAAVILKAAMLRLTVGSPLVRRLLIIGGCLVALLIGCSRA